MAYTTFTTRWDKFSISPPVYNIKDKFGWYLVSFRCSRFWTRAYCIKQMQWSRQQTHTCTTCPVHCNTTYMTHRQEKHDQLSGRSGRVSRIKAGPNGALPTLRYKDGRICSCSEPGTNRTGKRCYVKKILSIMTMCSNMPALEPL